MLEGKALKITLSALGTGYILECRTAISRWGCIGRAAGFVKASLSRHSEVACQTAICESCNVSSR